MTKLLKEKMVSRQSLPSKIIFQNQRQSKHTLRQDKSKRIHGQQCNERCTNVSPSEKRKSIG